MVGAGATGFQVAPAIADRCRSLTVLQRTAQWMFPNPATTTRSGRASAGRIRHLPFYGRWFRFLHASGRAATPASPRPRSTRTGSRSSSR